MLVLFAALVFTSDAGAQGSRIFLTSPMGGENWIVDSTYKIRWFMQNVTGTLHIEYSVDSAATWKLIDTMTAHTGSDSLAWRVPNDTTLRGFVRIRATDTTVRASNRTPIAITTVPLPILRLLYPNGGELLRTDSAYYVRWTSNYTHGPLEIEYSLDSGVTWRAITSVVPNAGIDSTLWSTPPDTSNRVLVRASSAADNISDVSNRSFSLRSVINPKITLSYPNGGEVFEVDSTVRVRWIGQDLAGQVVAQYSPDAGATWKAIGQPRTARIGADSLTWRIPNDTTRAALVRITHNGSSAGDTSNAVFSIIPDPNPPVPPTPTVAMLSQFAGAVFRADSVVTIRWTSANITGPVTVEYSPDSGSSWLPIQQTSQRSGIDSVRWTVPNDSTHTAVIRVRNSDATVENRTAGTFTVLPRLPVVGIDGETKVAIITSVSPNPANGSVAIRWMQQATDDVTVRIVDASGRVVYRRDEMTTAGERMMALDVHALASGSYRFEIESGAARSSVAIVVVH